MKKILIVTAALGAASLMYAQGAASSGTSNDQNFLKQASEGNRAEIDMGRLAQKNASN